MAPELEELFERSSPLARRLAEGPPWSSAQELVARARALLPLLSEEEKVATLAAHPRIGDAGAATSARSRAEQGVGALPELDRLNDAYERRFGFRFVVFVNRRSKPEIADLLRQRLRRGRAEELAAGLQAIVDIAEDRLRG